MNTAGLMARIDKRPDGCWLWTGGRNQGGYGLVNRVCDDGRRTTTVAHRAVYEILVGPVPSGLELDHLCRVRACVNPSHLEPVTPRENTHRSGHGEETHCLVGHPFDATNTYIRSDGSRQCRGCVRRRSRGYYAQQKAPVST